MKRGQITKKQIPAILAQFDAWETKYSHRIDMLGTKFAAWVEAQLAELRSRVESQDYLFAVQSHLNHVMSTMRRMEDGEIVDVSSDGTSFTLARL